MKSTSQTLQGQSKQFHSIDQAPLEKQTRRLAEEKILAHPDLTRTDRGILQAILQGFAWGKADCFPSNGRLAARALCSVATVKRSLARLKALGILIVFADSQVTQKGKRILLRRIILSDHPNAEAVLEALREPSKIVQGVAQNEPGSRVKMSRGGWLKMSPESVKPLSPKVQTPPPIPQGGGPPIQDPQSQRGEEGRREIHPGENGRTETPARASSDGNGSRPKFLPSTGRKFRSIANLDEAPPEIRAMATARGPAMTEEMALARALGSVQEPPGATHEEKADPGEVPGVQATQEAHQAVKMAPRVYLPDQERAILDLMKGLGQGSTDGEIGHAAFKVAMALGDGKSLRYWKRVCQLVAIGRIPRTIFGGVAGPGIRSPAAVYAAKIKAHVPDLHATDLPLPLGQRRRDAIPGGRSGGVNRLVLRSPQEARA